MATSTVELPFLESLVNSLDCGVMLVEDEGGIVMASHPLAAMFGLTESACKMRVSRAKEKVQERHGQGSGIKDQDQSGHRGTRPPD